MVLFNRLGIYKSSRNCWFSIRIADFLWLCEIAWGYQLLLVRTDGWSCFEEFGSLKYIHPAMENHLVGGLEHVFIFHNIWDNPSHWLIFFKMVKTTNQSCLLQWWWFCWYNMLNCSNQHFVSGNCPFGVPFSDTPPIFQVLLVYAMNKYCTQIIYSVTLRLFNIAMGNGPFIDGLPIKNGDFPWLC